MRLKVITITLLAFKIIITMENLNNLLIEKPATLKMLAAWHIVSKQIDVTEDIVPVEVLEFLSQIKSIDQLWYKHIYTKFFINLVNSADMPEDKICKDFNGLLEKHKNLSGTTNKEKILNGALLGACYNRNLEFAKLALSLGANIDTQDSEGMTPLILSLCFSFSEPELEQMLIERGCDVNLSDKNSNTPLILAAGIGNEKLVEILINAGSDVNHKNITGHTPLMLAAGYSRKSVVKTLLKKGAKPDIKNIHGKNALNLVGFEVTASEKVNNKITKKLLKSTTDC